MRSRGTDPRRPIDLGWLFVLPGVALIAAGVLIAAEDDLYEARFHRDEALAIERRHAERVDRYRVYLEALERQDPTVVRSLVVSQLNAAPTDLVEARVPGAPVYDSPEVFSSLEPSPAEPARRVRVESVLARWATDDASRMWLLASGALCVFVGLLPPANRRRAIGGAAVLEEGGTEATEAGELDGGLAVGQAVEAEDEWAEAGEDADEASPTDGADDVDDAAELEGTEEDDEAEDADAEDDGEEPEDALEDEAPDEDDSEEDAELEATDEDVAEDEDGTEPEDEADDGEEEDAGDEEGDNDGPDADARDTADDEDDDQEAEDEGDGDDHDASEDAEEDDPALTYDDSEEVEEEEDDASGPRPPGPTLFDTLSDGDDRPKR